MIAKKDLELLENSAVKLTLTIEKDAVKTEYDNLVKKYTKDAHIKGFRPGKVPPSVLIQKFGDSLKAETTVNVMEEGLKVAYGEIEQKPLPYATPEVDGDPLVDLDSDFTFTVTFDVFPEIKLGAYEGLELEEPACKITDEDVAWELESIRDQNSMVVEKSQGKVEEGDIININYAELDESGAEIEDARREDFVFTVGSGYNLYKLDKDVTGMAKDEEKVIEKTFPEDFDNSELAGTTKKLKVKVNNIKVKDLPALDDELAQDVSDEFKTLDDLKKSIRERLENQLKSRLDQMKKDSLIEKILETSTVPVPKSMVEAELDNQWQNFLMQSRMPEEQILQILEIQNKKKDDLLGEWKPGAEKSIKSYLILNKLQEEVKIEVTDEEIDQEIKVQAEASKMTFEETKEYIQKNGMTEYLKNDLINKKLFEKLFSQSKIKKGKKISFLDLTGKNQ